MGGGAAPSWSRDGRFIAYYAPGDSTGKAGIYVRAVDQPDAKFVRAGHNMFPGSWFPDGRSITFATNDPLDANVALGPASGSLDIGKVTLGDTAVTWLVKTPFSERQPELSPDGRLLAYASNRHDRRRRGFHGGQANGDRDPSRD